MHWIKDQQFSKAINDFLNNEQKFLEIQKENLKKFTPFKKLD
jgi:predicted N-acyltransferase